MRHLLGMALATTAVALQPAMAQTAEPGAVQESWTYELQLYLWGTEVGGVAAGADFELGFDEILEDLNFALMGGLRAYNGPWMTYGEASYASLTQGGSAEFPIAPGAPGGGAKVETVTDAKIETTIVSFGGGYQFVDTPGYSLYGTFGTRFLQLKTDLTLNANLGAINRSFEVDWDESYWDAVVGVLGRAAINDNWFVSYILDVGAGQSDLTWQAGIGVGYDFGRSDVVLAWRQVEWDLPDDDLVSEYYQKGPLLLWNYRF